MLRKSQSPVKKTTIQPAAGKGDVEVFDDYVRKAVGKREHIFYHSLKDCQENEQNRILFPKVFNTIKKGGTHLFVEMENIGHDLSNMEGLDIKLGFFIYDIDESMLYQGKNHTEALKKDNRQSKFVIKTKTTERGWHTLKGHSKIVFKIPFIKTIEWRDIQILRNARHSEAILKNFMNGQPHAAQSLIKQLTLIREHLKKMEQSFIGTSIFIAKGENKTGKTVMRAKLIDFADFVEKKDRTLFSPETGKTQHTKRTFKNFQDNILIGLSNLIDEIGLYTTPSPGSF